MNYLYGYLVVGVVYGLSVWILHKLRPRKNELNDTITAAMDKAREGQPFSFLEDILVPFLAILIIVTAWPVLIVMHIRDKRRFERRLDDDGEEQFTVTAEDVLEQLTIQEIEQREMVMDPLHSVPDLPFGHLNPVWVKFKQSLNEQDAIYSFTKIWQPPLSLYPEEVSGYVCVRDEQPEHFILTKVVELRLN
jgi:heme/copper-type cytochrome/quinol oxidase subunit 2